MKTIKIIDLLIEVNKFNNGKCAILPKKIKWNTKFYYLKKDAIDGHCYYDNSSYKTFIAKIDDFTQLNDEVEIITEDKEIEKLENEIEFYSYSKYEELKNGVDKVLYILKAINLVENKISNLNNKINELIDKVNKLERGNE